MIEERHDSFSEDHTENTAEDSENDTLDQELKENVMFTGSDG